MLAYCIPHVSGAASASDTSDTSDNAKSSGAPLLYPCNSLVLKQLPTRSPHRKLYDIAIVILSLTDQKINSKPIQWPPSKMSTATSPRICSGSSRVRQAQNFEALNEEDMDQSLGKRTTANRTRNPGKNSAQLFKQRMSGGLYFSRDPLNLVNKHSRKVRTAPPYSLTKPLTLHSTTETSTAKQSAFSPAPKARASFSSPATPKHLTSPHHPSRRRNSAAQHPDARSTDR